jgi:integrase
VITVFMLNAAGAREIVKKAMDREAAKVTKRLAKTPSIGDQSAQHARKYLRRRCWKRHILWQGVPVGREPDEVPIPPWRLHDLRRTAVTGMARAGADLHVIERAVNHVSGSFGGVVATYQKHRYALEVRGALDGWATLLSDIVSEIPRANVSRGNIVPLRQGA